jgi:hypothetical protein
MGLSMADHAAPSLTSSMGRMELGVQRMLHASAQYCVFPSGRQALGGFAIMASFRAQEWSHHPNYAGHVLPLDVTLDGGKTWKRQKVTGENVDF